MAHCLYCMVVHVVESDGWAGREADNANVDSSSGSSTPKQGSPALVSMTDRCQTLCCSPFLLILLITTIVVSILFFFSCPNHCN